MIEDQNEPDKSDATSGVKPWQSPDPDLVQQGMDRVTKAGEDKLKAMESPEFPFAPHILAYLKAISNIADLHELPVIEEEIKEWEEKNPEKAARLAEAIDHLSGEFQIDMHPIIFPPDQKHSE